MWDLLDRRTTRWEEMSTGLNGTWVRNGDLRRELGAVEETPRSIPLPHLTICRSQPSTLITPNDYLCMPGQTSRGQVLITKTHSITLPASTFHVG